MVNKNCILATLAAFVTMFVLGYVIYQPVLGDFFAANVGTATGVIKETPVFWQIIVGQLAGATLLVYVLSWRGVENAADGFKTGAMYGLLLSLYFGFIESGDDEHEHDECRLGGCGRVARAAGGGGRGRYRGPPQGIAARTATGSQFRFHPQPGVFTWCQHSASGTALWSASSRRT